MNVVNKILL